MFIYGILLAVSGKYTVYSNLESGKGRSDCLIKPIDKEQYAVVIEFKHCRDVPWRSHKEPACSSKPSRGVPLRSPEFLREEALNALKQIEEKVYIHHLQKEGYQRIFKYAITFHKKNCEVEMETVFSWTDIWHENGCLWLLALNKQKVFFDHEPISFVNYYDTFVQDR